jgi:hypothetical protein
MALMAAELRLGVNNERRIVIRDLGSRAEAILP